MKTPVRAYVGLGSNLDRPADRVRAAFDALDRLEGTRCVGRSPLYLSEPLGPPGQPRYVNAAAGLQTALAPSVLLRALHAIEVDHGRIRGVRWGPRTLDLDLLVYDGLRQDDPGLTLPHPRLHERAFVLYPLQDIAPDLIIPGLGPLGELLARCPGAGLKRLVEG